MPSSQKGQVIGSCKRGMKFQVLLKSWNLIQVKRLLVTQGVLGSVELGVQHRTW
jgi:hypothetical protein